MKENEIQILDYVTKYPLISSKEIFDGLDIEIGYSTVRRILKKLVNENYLELEGAGRGSKYKVSLNYSITKPIDLKEYFEFEIDDRNINEEFDLN